MTPPLQPHGRDLDGHDDGHDERHDDGRKYDDRRGVLERAGELDSYYDWARGLSGTRRLSALLYAGMGVSITVGMLTSPVLVGIPLWAGSAAAALMLDRRKWEPARLLRRWSDCVPVTGAALQHCPAGTAVRMRGRVRLRDVLPGLLAPAMQGAWQTLVVHEAVLRQRLLFRERGRDFDLGDASGVRVRVEVAQARLLLSVPSEVPWTSALQPVRAKAKARVEDFLPPSVRGPRPLTRANLRAWEFVLAEDCEVEVFGLVQHIIGPGPAVSRSVPTRPALVGSDTRPLLIVPR